MTDRDSAFFDTNVLIYAFTSEDPRKKIAEELIIKGGTIGVQTLNEFVSVKRQKSRASWEDLLYWLGIIEKLCSPPLPMTASTHLLGLQIAQTYGYHIYDSLMLAAAVEANCTIFYTEDLHHGHKLGDLTIRNPFKRAR
ncbi:MAG TPA: PIN domain-containing protein [Bryobacteraceae bacterium]|nr:PIN domain-containing protein [Bryobacteraceae bacterium]